MDLIPAIDLLGGKCVRLYQGDFARATVYADDPVRVAEAFFAEGAKRLHIVDLDGARTGVPSHTDVLSMLARRFPDRLQVGGGIRGLASAELLLGVGVARVIVGTRLLESDSDAELLFRALGDRVIAGIDARDGFVAAHGWTETGSVEAIHFARRMIDLGCRRIVYTDIATDGTLAGPNLQAMRAMVEASPVPVVASGGIGSLADLVGLAQTGVEAAIVGRAIYEGRFTVSQALAALG